MTETKFKLQIKQSDIDEFDTILQKKSDDYDIVTIGNTKYIVQVISSESDKGVSVYPRQYAIKNSFKDGLQMYSNKLSIGELKYRALKWLLESDTSFYNDNIEYEVIGEPVKPKLSYDELSKYTVDATYDSKQYPSCCKHCSSIISCKKLLPISSESWVDYKYCDKCNTFLAIVAPDQQACEGQGKYVVEEHSYDFIKNKFSI